MRWVRTAVVVLAAAFGLVAPAHAAAQPGDVLRGWYDMVLSLTRHTATMTPPVASRAYGYVGVTAYEAVASGSTRLQTLAGQLNGLSALPSREPGAAYDEAVVLDAALHTVIADLFRHTGPMGHRALDGLEARLMGAAAEGLDPEIVSRSAEFGAAIAKHVLDWSRSDGGDKVENMGFPYHYTPKPGPQYWIPTNLIVLQQAPLLPDWGQNRPFAMPTGASCPTPPPPAYSEDPESTYFKQAKEVYDTWKSLTAEQRAIARFWADDAMLSVTPPGHWLQIGLNALKDRKAGVEDSVDLLARLGIGVADAFIGCWNTKYVYDAVRPYTFIRKVIDPTFDTVVLTPPFPEFPSGHSTQSAAAATVLTAVIGDNYAFTDNTDEADGLVPRSFKSFFEAADEAGISRLYGGIHYRAAIELGAAQGRCIAAHAVALKTWR